MHLTNSTTIGRRGAITAAAIAIVSSASTVVANAETLEGGGYGTANDNLLRENPQLARLVREEQRTETRTFIREALDEFRLISSAAAPTASATATPQPMAQVCIKIYKWQVTAMSWAVDAGELIGKIRVGDGKISWPSIFESWGLNKSAGGKSIRAWAKKQSWPKTVCASEGPA